MIMVTGGRLPMNYDEWRTMMNDAEWWCMMLNDAEWWSTTMNVDGCRWDENCSMMMKDDEWRWMVMMNGDEDERRWMMMCDDEWWWLVIWWTMMNDSEWWRMVMKDDELRWWMMMCDDTHKTWWEAVGRKEPGNHFGTVAVLGRSQFVLRCDVRGYPLFHIARQRNELMEWVESNFGAALDAESGISCWQHCNGWEFCSSDIAIVSLFVKLSSSHHRITHHTTTFYTYIHMYLLYVHECSEMCF